MSPGEIFLVVKMGVTGVHPLLPLESISWSMHVTCDRKNFPKETVGWSLALRLPLKTRITIGSNFLLFAKQRISKQDYFSLED